MKNRIVFFGTPLFAAELLTHLAQQNTPLVGIVTQPDKERGRALHVTPSAVKEQAQRLGLKCPVLQPEKASEEAFLHELASLQGDLYVVVAYGQLLPQRLLSIPPLGCINIHASLLPKYRGAAPIQRCLMAGDRETGVSIQKMVRKMDAGDVIAFARIEIPLEMTYGILTDQLCNLSKSLIVKVLSEYEAGIPQGQAQDESQVTFAPKIETGEAEIRWDAPAMKIHNQIRALSPKPGAWAWTEVGAKRLKILHSQPVQGEGPPGQILSRKGIVACGEGAIELLEVVPEGKKAMAGSDWLRGAPLFSSFPKSLS